MATKQAAKMVEARGFSLSLRMVSLVILVVAIFVSSYLTYLKISSADAICLDSGKFDCGTVLNSAYSEIGGIPIAILGLVTNLIIGALLLLEPRFEFFEENTPSLVFGVNLFTFLFSVYLVYLQARVIKAYCPWCLTHELMLTLLFIVTCIRLYQKFKPA